MLILCLGPDTFRAQEKAHELENAFKSKYDLAGSSIERLPAGKEAVEEVMKRVNTPSLFAPRRYIYAPELMANCPAAKIEPLAKALSQNVEQVIVVSVESEQPEIKILKKIESITKVVKYEFPELTGNAFYQWLKSVADCLNVTDGAAVSKIAEAADGDSWQAFNELMKVAAGGQSEIAVSGRELSVFDYADQYIQNKKRYEFLSEADIGGQFLNPLLSQTRAALRVRDNATAGMHPFVVKKLQRLRVEQPEVLHAAALLALFMQRSGAGREDEVVDLL